MYRDVAARTDSCAFLGVVGPVRTGKSTFIKRFMELMVLPQLTSQAVRQRTVDELPQSAAGRTIMTTEPKFIPEQPVKLELEGGVFADVRLIDCVGYMVRGAMGSHEDEKPRMVKSPWYDEAVPFDVAAETGTKKVICDHSTIGLVVTTDGSISDIPRESYEEAEERVVNELKELNKPFVILLNCVNPEARQSKELAQKLSEKYDKAVLPVSCVELTQETITEILKEALYEFPVKEIAFKMPKWVNQLEKEHWLQTAVYSAVRDYAEDIVRIRDIGQKGPVSCEYLKESRIASIDLGTGSVTMELTLDPGIFYQILGETTGLALCDEASLMPCVIELARIKKEYEKIQSALEQVEATGYGIVMPTISEMKLEEPEIVKQGGRYGVRLRASSPSIHMMKATITTEVSPIVGTENQSQELVMSLLNDFEEDPIKIWESNIFGKSLHELVNEGLQNKLMHMPDEARGKLQETLERIINEGCSGLICIIL
ncbi:MAG: stage IV sporulation protein A [Oscillospiraceae bacterium]|nr:stage IV sporulation protein A [Oscillospiraceae bacterium]